MVSTLSAIETFTNLRLLLNAIVDISKLNFAGVCYRTLRTQLIGEIWKVDANRESENIHQLQLGRSRRGLAVGKIAARQGSGLTSAKYGPIDRITRSEHDRNFETLFRKPLHAAENA